MEHKNPRGGGGGEIYPNGGVGGQNVSTSYKKLEVVVKIWYFCIIRYYVDNPKVQNAIK